MASAEPTPRVAGRGRRSTPELLKNLRHLRVVLFHPKDADGELLASQLQRIGCQVLSLWPPVQDLPDTVDIVVLAVRPEHAATSFNWTRLERPPAVVAVIDYENPTIVDAVLRLGARAVLTSPVRTAGVLSALVLASSINEELQQAQRRVARLEQKLQSANEISEAKLILMRTRNMSDGEAYRVIREQAMSKRVATEDIARAIIHANAILSFDQHPT